MKLQQGGGLGTLLARASSGSLLVMMTSAALAFASQLVFARILGTSEYGVYVFTLSWVNILSAFVSLGLDTSFVRFVPAYLARSEWGALRGLLQFGLSAVLLAGAVLGVAVILFVRFFHDRVGAPQAAIFQVAVVLLPLVGLTRLRQAALRGLGLVVRAFVPDEIVRPCLLVALAAAAYLLAPQHIGALSLMGLNVACAAAAFLLGSYWLYLSLPTAVKHASRVQLRAEWMTVSVPMLLISGANLLLQQTDIVMLGAMASKEQAGIYAVASRISALAVFGLAAANGIVAPLISSYYAQNRTDALRRLLALSAHGVFAFSLLVSVALWLAGPALLGMFGSEFVAGYAATSVLLVGQVINAGCGSVGFLMTMTKHQVAAAWILVMGAAINVVLNYVLIPPYGLLGAAWATAVSMVLWNVAMVAFVVRVLRINPTVISRIPLA
jgi:O-antigen/teichoic acid export membrane protein